MWILKSLHCINLIYIHSERWWVFYAKSGYKCISYHQAERYIGLKGFNATFNRII